VVEAGLVEVVEETADFAADYYLPLVVSAAALPNVLAVLKRW